MIQTEISFFIGLSEGIRHCLKEGESLETVQNFSPTDLDFRAEIEKLRHRKFDILGLYFTAPQLRAFFQQAETLRFRTRYFGATQLYDRGMLKAYPESMAGMLLTHNLCSESFIGRYSKRFGDDTHVCYSAHIYSVAIILADLFGDGRKRSGEEIVGRLGEISEVEVEGGKAKLETDPGGGRFFDFPAGVFRVGPDLKFVLER